MTKQWYKSRTLWVNLLAFSAFMTQHVTGQVWLDSELQGAILTILNVILRFDTHVSLE